MLNSYTFNSTQFNSVQSDISIIIELNARMYADIYINNEQLNLTVDNDICELIIDG